MNPYREPAPQCQHLAQRTTMLQGGDGPDDAAALITCLDCHAYRWRYCDRTSSDWRQESRGTGAG